MHKKLTTSCIAILLFVNLARAHQTAQLSLTEIVSRVAKTYASCNSYMDETRTEISFDDVWEREHRFSSTTFLRSSRFRFEESSSSAGNNDEDQYIVWKDGERGKVWSTFLSATSEYRGPTPFINAALRSTSEHIILALLRPDLFRRYVLTNVTLAGQESVDGRMAFRIDGKLMGQATSMWVDQQQFLVRKISQRFGPRRSTTTTRIKPQLNVDIPPEKLAFNPPPVPNPISGQSGVEVISFNRSDKVRKQSKLRANLDYLYELQIRNRGSQEIAAVAWDHVVIDPVNKRENRQSLLSYKKVDPNESGTFSATISQGRSKVVNVEKVERDLSAAKRAEVRCVIYADGSWWKPPESRGFECEYFSAVSRWKKLK